MKKSKVQSQFDALLCLDGFSIIPFVVKHNNHLYSCRIHIKKLDNQYFVLVHDLNRGDLFSFRLNFIGYKVYNVLPYTSFIYYPDDLERFSPAIKVGCTDIQQWFRYLKASIGIYLDMNLFS